MSYIKNRGKKGTDGHTALEMLRKICKGIRKRVLTSKKGKFFYLKVTSQIEH